MNKLQKHLSRSDFQNPWIPAKHGELMKLLQAELNAQAEEYVSLKDRVRQR